MQLTEAGRSLAKQLAYLIAIHAFSFFFCAFARERIDLLYSLSLYYPILAPLIFVPIVVGFFLSTKYGRQASVALIGILPAEAIYLLYDRFRTAPQIARIGSSPGWNIIYEGSFGITLILEAIGFWLAVKLLLEIHRQIDVSRT
jgi:hypothetical protein